MSFCCECCVLSGRGLCDELITHPEESYQNVVRRSVRSRNVVSDEALAQRGLSRNIKKSTDRDTAMFTENYVEKSPCRTKELT